jgi:2-keto-4-pentenoate hydratase/2-oxohepta-3-ene-1,7-dioic acid hydratase in catechol pathway
MWGFLKASDAVIGPGGTVVLPPNDANIFHHEAELVLVFGRAGKDIKEEDAFDYVFGYTCGVDVSARMPATPGGRAPDFQAWRGISAHKSYPTFAPMGPAIVTKDEVKDPQDVGVQLSVNGQLRGDFNTSDMAHSIAKSIVFVSQHEGFDVGDVLYTGTNHQGLGAMQDSETINIEIDQVGGFAFQVSDPLKRRWPTGVDEETAQDVREGTGGPGRRKRPIS